MVLATMFFRRSIQDPTFGTLRPYRDGTYWRGRAEFGPARQKVWVAIRSADDGIDAAAGRLFGQISHRYGVLQEKVLQVLHRECEKGRKGRPGDKWPKASEPRDLLRLAPLDEIWIEDTAERRFMFSFRSTADRDHHIHLFFKNGKLEAVSSER